MISYVTFLSVFNWMCLVSQLSRGPKAPYWVGKPNTLTPGLFVQMWFQVCELQRLKLVISGLRSWWCQKRLGVFGIIFSPTAVNERVKSNTIRLDDRSINDGPKIGHSLWSLTYIKTPPIGWYDLYDFRRTSGAFILKRSVSIYVRQYQLCKIKWRHTANQNHK